jgi:sterol desaturase/sphingolipid hydroxylase (fatty acid hydroxylase superfamily)
LHHRLEPKYRNKNFATWLTFWDRILGTHAVADENVAPVFGVPAELNVPSDFWHQMTFPFKSRKTE